MLSRRLAASEEEAARPVRHPGDLIRVTAGALILAASAAVAGRSTAARSEVDLFRLINDLPSALTVPLVVVMQAGTLAAVFVAAGLALAARRWRLARDLARLLLPGAPRLPEISAYVRVSALTSC